MIAAALAALTETTPTVFGVPLDFILFGLTLLGVAVFHHHTLKVALTGLLTITIYKILFTGFIVVMVAIGERRWKAMELALDTPEGRGEGSRS